MLHRNPAIPLRFLTSNSQMAPHFGADNGTACDDSYPGTINDMCIGGVCVGIRPTCANQNVTCPLSSQRLNYNTSCIPGQTWYVQCRVASVGSYQPIFWAISVCLGSSLPHGVRFTWFESVRACLCNANNKHILLGYISVECFA
jgi:hypothetical protein